MGDSGLRTLGISFWQESRSEGHWKYRLNEKQAVSATVLKIFYGG